MKKIPDKIRIAGIVENHRIRITVDNRRDRKDKIGRNNLAKSCITFFLAITTKEKKNPCQEKDCNFHVALSFGVVG